MTKSNQAFRTISEVSTELEVPAHVLRFWESKFSQIRPIKRAGGRRLYRAEDIDLLRGIKILLHEEKHPIKDVQKIIRLKGPNKVIELGQTVQKAATPKDVEDTVLIPERIATTEPPPSVKPISVRPDSYVETKPVVPETVAQAPVIARAQTPPVDVMKLKAVLARLKAVKSRWDDIDQNSSM